MTLEYKTRVVFIIDAPQPQPPSASARNFETTKPRNHETTKKAGHKGTKTRRKFRGLAFVVSCLRHDLGNRNAVNVGQPHVAAVVPVRELLVIDAEQVEDCRVQIVIRRRLLLRLV